MLFKTNPPETKFGRLYAPDPRDRLFLLSKSRTAILYTQRFWQTPNIVQDQGSTPQCVGYSGYHFLASAPYMERKGRVLPLPSVCYQWAQDNDEWAGNNYEGSSVRGMMKAFQKQGLIEGYLWSPDSETMKSHVIGRGPLNAGTDWFEGMSRPLRVGTQGEAWLEPSGEYQGGHAYLIVGYSRKRNAYRMFNSWGEDWGEKGRAWIKRDVLDHLIFAMNGEAASAIEKRAA
jgi:hypothetical protein